MKKSIRDLEISNKKVLIRCDFNVPMKNGEIRDDNRIVTSIPTIKYALEQNAKVILFSHLGKVKEESDLEKNNLRPVATRLSELLGKEVTFVSVTRGEELENAVNSMNFGDVILVQNTRYEDLDGKKESKNDEELATYWASLGDVFVNDAFGTLHRAHASNSGLASKLPSGIGFLVEKELTELSRLDNPEKPFVLILGGSKVADKIGVIENLVTKADYILIGGGMAFTFLKASGINTAKSVIDEESLDFAKKMVEMYPEKIILPTDVNAFVEFNNDAENRYVNVNELNDVNYDVIVVDPPRAGLDSTTIKKLLDSGSDKIVYVSCNPITLARDIKLLSDRYEVGNITLFDMFPNTKHVECVIKLRLKK